MAEETGLIHELGEQVLRQVCAQGKVVAGKRAAARADCRQHLPPPAAPGRVRVPWWSHASRSPAFRLLEFELTESVLIEDNPHDLEKLHRSRSMGALLAIDDFGTKYSSFGYLKRLPVDRLKIDRSFVRDLPGDSSGVEIATAIIAMSRALNLEVVAEGVETREQAEMLRERGCHYLQGYYCGRPMPPEELRLALVGGGMRLLVRAEGSGIMKRNASASKSELDLLVSSDWGEVGRVNEAVAEFLAVLRPAAGDRFTVHNGRVRARGERDQVRVFRQGSDNRAR